MSGVKQTSKEQRLEIVNYCIDHGADYLQAIRKYGVSYGQVYSWVSKFRKYGEHGLDDLRGTGRSRKESPPMGELERLKVENRCLKASIGNLKAERHVLKKRVKYLERKENSNCAEEDLRSGKS
ncbi:transposase [Pyramidobacter sp. SM-530-WT-4B]|uniref:Transposase n=1 Tax=Pyramidobacter porci TaxID=2605789 RepID=A0A6L5YCB6_9BACT|nr:helix-turn-helix domain-containing protein [Pyramidobacter porci]MST55976.1 transposase [Pyramidobacter porci]